MPQFHDLTGQFSIRTGDDTQRVVWHFERGLDLEREFTIADEASGSARARELLPLMVSSLVGWEGVLDDTGSEVPASEEAFYRHVPSALRRSVLARWADHLRGEAPETSRTASDDAAEPAPPEAPEAVAEAPEAQAQASRDEAASEPLGEPRLAEGTVGDVPAPTVSETTATDHVLEVFPGAQVIGEGAPPPLPAEADAPEPVHVEGLAADSPRPSETGEPMPAGRFAPEDDGGTSGMTAPGPQHATLNDDDAARSPSRSRIPVEPIIGSAEGQATVVPVGGARCVGALECPLRDSSGELMSLREAMEEVLAQTEREDLHEPLF